MCGIVFYVGKKVEIVYWYTEVIECFGNVYTVHLRAKYLEANEQYLLC